jgi:hypothetical protein
MNLDPYSGPEFKKFDLPGRTKLGRLAGKMLLRALSGGPLITNKREREAWKEMHGAAHMWAADTQIEMSPETLPRWLLLAERFLDRMKIAGIDTSESWFCPAELRTELERREKEGTL